MQPNQQDQDQNLASQQPASMPYEVPSYLQLDPVMDLQPKKSKKKLIFAVSLLATLSLFVGLFALYGNVIFPSPEDKFYKAFYSLMNTSYFHREINIDNADLQNDIKVVADSDFSDPDSPKSKISYDYNDSTGVSIAGNIVTFDSEQYVGRITAAPTGFPVNLKLNQWYKATHSQPYNRNPDVFGVYIDTNSSLGGILMGNYSNKSSNKILERIRESDVYTVESTKSVVRDNDKYTEYAIKVNYQKLNDLAEKINSEFHTKLRPTTISSTNTVEVLISDKSGKITEIVEKIKQQGLQVNVKTAISYPASISIEIPDSIGTD